MAFGSDSFPLGPGGKFPKQRLHSFSNGIANPNQMEGIYANSNVAKLPVVERDFHSSVDRVKLKFKNGVPHKNSKGKDEYKRKPKSWFGW